MRRLIARAARAVPRPAAKIAYDRVIGGEIAFEAALEKLGARRRRDRRRLDVVTAIVKTFERPLIVRRLVRSIQRRHPGLRIIVVDDSRTPTLLPGVETITLPYNVGVSVGRQEALDRVTTQYCVVLDDDHVFYRGTGLEEALAIIDGRPEIDILGGDEILLPFYSPSTFWLGEVYPTRPPTKPPGSTIAGLAVCDRVPNFFLTRTDRLRLVGWDPDLKTLDHIDFFSRARGVLTTVFDPRFRVLHARTPFDAHYMQRRLDFDASFAVLRNRYGEMAFALEGLPDGYEPQPPLRPERLS